MVECYAGRKPDERPVRFWVGERKYAVERIVSAVVRTGWCVFQSPGG